MLHKQITALYHNACTHVHELTELVYQSPGELDNIIDSVLKKVHDKRIKAGDLNADLWLANANKIWSGAQTGLGDNWNKTPKSTAFALQLQENVFAFTAFKNHANINELAGLLTKNGQAQTFEEFYKDAKPIMNTYNKAWLQAEFNQATGTARMAAKWQDYAARGGKLEYVTVNDGHVREEHQVLHGTILPVDHQFWDMYYPPNGWGCRCTVRWRSDETESKGPNGLPEKMPPEFRFNAGKAGKIFSPEHPYIKTLNIPFKNRVKENLEKLKTLAPPTEINKIGNRRLTANPFADKGELEKNLERGEIMLRDLKTDVELPAHVNITNVKNPEFTLFGAPADCKTNNKLGGIQSRIKEAGEQQCKTVIIDTELLQEFNSDQIASRIKGALNPDRNRIIENIVLIVDGKAKMWKRKKIWDDATVMEELKAFLKTTRGN